MEMLETVFNYIVELFGDIDFTEIINGITEAVEFIVSLISG